MAAGRPRHGKSSILKQLPRLLGPDLAPALLDCQNPAVAGGEASTASLLRSRSAALSEGLQRRRVSVKPLAAEELAREPLAAFDAWLARVEQAMPAGMRALLCLDEYERLQRALDAGWGGDVLDALRHTLQHRPRFVLLFTGAHTFAELGPAWTDRFISARRVRVSFLQPDDVRPLLTKPILVQAWAEREGVNHKERKERREGARSRRPDWALSALPRLAFCRNPFAFSAVKFPAL